MKSVSILYCNELTLSNMGEYSVGDAIKLLMERSGWKPKATELRLRKEWDQIVGKAVANYTRDIALHYKTLIIYTDVAVLKQELTMGKEQLINNINQYLEETAITDIVIK